ncbi:MAG: Dyp-type peroxidase [Candidatus Manganitrophaceae bacterium]|nr:MAG: Dyp-type peroxidase [Candidatus Manganitrophaceae bacterium]
MKTDFSQPGILAAPSALGRSLTFRMIPETNLRAALQRLAKGFDVHWGVVGVGEPVVRALSKEVAGLRAFPGLAGPGCNVPSTQQALWFFLRGEDRGVLFDRTEQLRSFLNEAVILDDAMDTFLYAGGKDLTGYEDGTENPKENAAVEAAIIPTGKNVKGSSFVAVQRWVHDLNRFRSLPSKKRDAVMGRRLDTNEEIADAPESAHVKRSAQESYDPPAFMVRRSMPWATAHQQGLEFISYVESLDRYERVLRRMAGLEDGIVDALFTFSRPLTGGYYWCPPISGDRLNLSHLGI